MRFAFSSNAGNNARPAHDARALFLFLAIAVIRRRRAGLRDPAASIAQAARAACRDACRARRVCRAMRRASRGVVNTTAARA
ncbi:hypothetical protein F9948_15865 [Burkholderia thailandensis]|nr:hypothetical protein A8H32_14050 [Burkholderia thailandensis]MDD1481720.1 hypothetical protein [Burkholderia thailandensis]MDD1487587.1 hypothetical protein [Burkholderia thailandensis]MDD1493230.1 hypothetical protein [Burkholderia thailandensis]TGB33002.1 hypothetical protein C6946_14645 [Burkholderia thailandensis]